MEKLMEFITKLFGSEFMPHGHCYLWDPVILWISTVSSFLIGLSYTIIPILLAILIVKRTEVPFPLAFWLFGAIISLCGLGHYFDIYTTWNGAYRLEAVIKAATAVVSLSTAYYAYKLLPAAIRLPTLSQYEQEIARRKKAEAELREALKDVAENNKKLRSHLLATLENEVSDDGTKKG